MPETERVDRIVDVASVVLISVAAVLTAICGYQSGRWGGQQSRLYAAANASRLQSAEAQDRANVLEAVDVAIFLHYVDAVHANDAVEANFLYTRFRPEMKRAMRAWIATKPLQNPGAPSSPFVMPQYALKANAQARALAALGESSFKLAVDATHHSDDFLLLTIIFAAVSFLAGISTKMTYPRHAIIVVVGVVALVYGLVRLVELPFL
jgi:hypothetical protein